ncbi:hypothetical protein Rhopal_003262-T1 [Rhodotorula paludigena]|uniref:Uncharacterized protein n=1 Tax=Rhodotorula paludigena TaxID=86838 RepID=A0AAV5GCP8_9BASI|nr:hypothetical protein Rhopal_003262-T1 [Rhodotorula paludigena]
MSGEAVVRLRSAAPPPEDELILYSRARSSSEVDDFLSKYPPSKENEMVSLGGWYWCHMKEEGGTAKPAEDLDDDEPNRTKFEKAVAPLVDKLTADCAHIKETAPSRANKAKRIRSQKDLREDAYAEFNNGVKQLAQEHGILSGKWLFYPTPEYVDMSWSKIVHALAEDDGALAKTGVVKTAKVSSKPGDGGKSFVICVYCRDSWDKDGVGKAFKTLVKDLNLISTAYKCDANTIAGIDSKHPSGIKSSLYGRTTFMTAEEISAAQEATSKAKAPKKDRTLEEETAAGGADGFDPVSDDEDEKPKRKKAKK